MKAVTSLLLYMCLSNFHHAQSGHHAATANPHAGSLFREVPIVCAKTRYDEWQVDFHHRFDEDSIYDCSSRSCGGQSVAILKCACGAPHTSYWKPGYNVANFCQHNQGTVIPGTSIATFEYGSYHNSPGRDDTGVFLGCRNGNIQVIEQACAYGTRYVEIGPQDSRFYRFSVVLTDPAKLHPGHHCTWRYTGC